MVTRVNNCFRIRVSSFETREGRGEKKKKKKRNSYIRKTSRLFLPLSFSRYMDAFYYIRADPYENTVFLSLLLARILFYIREEEDGRHGGERRWSRRKVVQLHLDRN